MYFKMYRSYTFFKVAAFFFSVHCLNLIPAVSSTNTPVIGILTQELANLESYYPDYTSYIAASYIKQVEASGARVVPILKGQSEEYYSKILSHVNGVVFPGGRALFNHSGGYREAAGYIMNILEKMNDEGEVVPLLAVCLGFEAILEISNNNEPFRRNCSIGYKNLSLQFLKGYRRSSLFSDVPSKYLKKLAKSNITLNSHRYCYEMRDMITKRLTEKWNVLSLSEYGKWKFVSTVEHKIYPFAGVQFHPEKNAFEWSENQHTNHSLEAIQITRIFYDWLSKMSRLNNHTFPSRDVLYKNLIENYHLQVIYPQKKVHFEQIYLFK